jgi:hypothetical protein
VKLVWFPAWNCQNYGPNGTSFGQKCRYCPYGYDKETKRLVFENRPTSSDERAPAADLIAFFAANRQAMGDHLEVSGGEPLLRQDLPEILASIPHRWAITSNTLMSTAIQRLAETGALERCVAWTASWHPCSGMEESYRRSITMISQAGRPARATVVIADSTIGRLASTVDFLNTLPLAGVNYHLDTHGPADVSHLKEAADAILGAGNVYLAGPPPQGKLCNRHDKLMAVGADGSLYQCVTFAYQDIEPICKVNGSVLLAELPQRVEWCNVPCMACCDHVKHEVA